jgi:ParB family chromosome partitioning protein
LIGLDDEAFATHLAERAAEEGWSVRQVEEAARARKTVESGPAPGKLRSLRPVEIIELEKRLTERLGADVKINYRNEKGKLEIKFGSLEELERIYRSFSG